ncbi:MAG TPA: 30S ribosomal protein S6 [Gemmatimonadaceae bacterium]|nr:30S ribosomal protein S6 [Gemmatimonadaceae bacterium]
MPRQYEAVYIFDPALEDAAIQEKLAHFHELLAPEGEVALEQWGRRQLAYPIQRKDNGYYVIARYAAEPAALPEYERALRLDDAVLRYLVALHEHEVGAPPLSEEELAAANARSDDDDEEE